MIWFFTKCVIPGLFCAFLTFAPLSVFGDVSAAERRAGIVRALIAAVAACSVVWALVLVYCVYLRRTYVYYVTNQRCVFRGGILQRIERSVPYHKVTDVEMRQNIVERVLGISKLNIFTPGTASVVNTPFGGPRAEISFIGLADSETPAATINETLRKFKATGE